MIQSNEPQEIASYRRRITGRSWIIAGVLGAGFAIFGMWDWTVGLILGLCLGFINFFLLCRQTARLAVSNIDQGKGRMIVGHWARYFLLGTVIFIVYKKDSVSFPAFLIGMMLIYAAIFLDAWMFRKSNGVTQS